MVASLANSAGWKLPSSGRVSQRWAPLTRVPTASVAISSKTEQIQSGITKRRRRGSGRRKASRPSASPATTPLACRQRWAGMSSSGVEVRGRAVDHHDAETARAAPPPSAPPNRRERAGPRPGPRRPGALQCAGRSGPCADRTRRSPRSPAWRSGRAVWECVRSCSLLLRKGLDGGAEALAALLVARELVEAGAGRREQDHVAGLRQLRRQRDGAARDRPPRAAAHCRRGRRPAWAPPRRSGWRRGPAPSAAAPAAGSRAPCPCRLRSRRCARRSSPATGAPLLRWSPWSR